MHRSVAVSLIFGVMMVAMFVMLIWLVQQSKQQAAWIARLTTQQQQLMQQLESKPKTKPVLAEATLASKAKAQQQKTKSSTLPKDARVLLEKALADARKLRKLEKKGKYSQARAVIPKLKEYIWKASDMLPDKAKTPLRKLMGVLDYTAKQLKQGKTGDTKTPVHTVKAALDGQYG